MSANARTVILDSGAFIAAQRRNRELASLIAAASNNGATIIIPATALAEVWREPPSHPVVMLKDAVDGIAPLDAVHACEVGALNGRTGRTQIADAHVALLAVKKAPSLVLTSDPKDIAALVRALGISVSIGTKGKTQSAVHIESI